MPQSEGEAYRSYPNPLDDTAPLTYRPRTAANQYAPAFVVRRGPHPGETSNGTGNHNKGKPFVLTARLVLNSTPFQGEMQFPLDLSILVM